MLELRIPVVFCILWVTPRMRSVEHVRFAEEKVMSPSHQAIIATFILFSVLLSPGPGGQG